jgi:cellulose synthase/poly-beta-1,6-N-acetylglucosamine synthase-like glycosyltransferase
MLTDWTHWLSSLTPDQFLAVYLGLLLFDTPRYVLGKVILCVWDWGADVWRWARGAPQAPSYSYCPSVCVVLAGYNEAGTIGATLHSVWGTYPRLEIVVVDDGSTDGMFDVASEFARSHAGVLVLRKPERGGKSSALNFGLAHARAEVVVGVDTDSHLAREALWEVVQPLQDPGVGAVSGTVLARNPFTNLVTWLQAYEYLQTIFVGRILPARLGILGIVSGAFAALRRTAVEQVGGWDVGPGEDADLTLRLRKAGYEIAFAPYAQCFSNVPTSWWGLIKQRLRWDRGPIRYKCRKHIDMAYFWSRNFRIADFFILLDDWVFSIFRPYLIFVCSLIWLCFFANEKTGYILFAIYLGYLGLHLISILVALVYSTAPGRDLRVCAVWPLVPFYLLFQRAILLIALTQELFGRRSFEDNFVPKRVREKTWHW